jgi:hypothetical protein
MNLDYESFTKKFSSKNLLVNSLFLEFKNHLSKFQLNFTKKFTKQKMGSIFLLGCFLSDLLSEKIFSEKDFSEFLKFLSFTEHFTFENLFQTIDLLFLCENLSSEKKNLLHLLKDFALDFSKHNEFKKLNLSKKKKEKFIISTGLQILIQNNCQKANTPKLKKNIIMGIEELFFDLLMILHIGVQVKFFKL